MNFFKKRKLHLIEGKTIFSIFVIIFVLEFIVFSNVFGIASYHKFLANIVSSVLVDLTNTERSSLSINKLTANQLLQKAAQLKAKDMVQKGYFAHTSPEGITPWYWFQEAGYSFSYAGENLGVNFIDSDILHKAWLDSEKHRKNILNEKFTEIGIGTAEGVYKGRNAIFVVQLFGKPKNIVQIEKKLSKEPEKEILATKEINKAPVAVLGEEISDIEEINPEIIGEADLFVVAKNLSPGEENGITLKENSKIDYSSFLKNIISTPKIFGSLLFFMGIIIFILAFFNSFKKRKLDFYSLGANSIIIFISISASFLINHWVFAFSGLVS